MPVALVCPDPGRPVDLSTDVLPTRPVEDATHGIPEFGDCAARLGLASVVGKRAFASAMAVHPRTILGAEAGIGPVTVVAGGLVANPGAVVIRNVPENVTFVGAPDRIFEESRT